MELRIAIIVVTSVISLVLLGVLAFLSLMRPGKSAVMEKYKSVKFAHRGLHGEGAAENSMTAFTRARDLGYGIEFDIRLAKDGQLVVFHDATLNRVCGVDGRVVDRTVNELSEISLLGTKDTVPTLREVLDLIDGAVPLLIEIKEEAGETSVAERFLEEIKGYTGEFIVESFNPFSLRAVKKARADIVIGILSAEYMKDDRFKGKFLYRMLQNLQFNFLMRPHFISYDKNGFANWGLRYVRRNYKTPLIAWTVTSLEEEREALLHGFDTVIFEGYLSEK